MKRGLLLVFLLAVSKLGSAESGIHAVVNLVEARYSVRHHGIPGLWLAKPFLIGSGVGGLKMAVFEDIRVPERDSLSLRDQMNEALGPDWHPFIEEWSRSGHECTLIYIKTHGSKVSMLIFASEEQGDLTLLQMNLNPKRLSRWTKEPIESAKNHHGSHSEGGTDLAMSSLR